MGYIQYRIRSNPRCAAADSVGLAFAEAGCFTGTVVSQDEKKFEVTIKIDDPESPDDQQVTSPCPTSPRP